MPSGSGKRSNQPRKERLAPRPKDSSLLKKSSGATPVAPRGQPVKAVSESPLEASSSNGTVSHEIVSPTPLPVSRKTALVFKTRGKKDETPSEFTSVDGSKVQTLRLISKSRAGPKTHELSRKWNVQKTNLSEIGMSNEQHSIERHVLRTPAETLLAKANLFPQYSFAEWMVLRYGKDAHFPASKAEGHPIFSRLTASPECSMNRSRYAVAHATFKQLSSRNLSDQAFFDAICEKVRSMKPRHPQRSKANRDATIERRKQLKSAKTMKVTVTTVPAAQPSQAPIVKYDPIVNHMEVEEEEFPLPPPNTNRFTPPPRSTDRKSRVSSTSAYANAREEIRKKVQTKEAKDSRLGPSKAEKKRLQAHRAHNAECAGKPLPASAAVPEPDLKKAQGLPVDILSNLTKTMTDKLGTHGRKMVTILLSVLSMFTCENWPTRAILAAQITVIAELDQNDTLRKIATLIATYAHKIYESCASTSREMIDSLKKMLAPLTEKKKKELEPEEMFSSPFSDNDSTETMSIVDGQRVYYKRNEQNPALMLDGNTVVDNFDLDQFDQAVMHSDVPPELLSDCYSLRENYLKIASYYMDNIIALSESNLTSMVPPTVDCSIKVYPHFMVVGDEEAMYDQCKEMKLRYEAVKSYDLRCDELNKFAVNLDNVLDKTVDVYYRPAELDALVEEIARFVKFDPKITLDRMNQRVATLRTTLESAQPETGFTVNKPLAYIHAELLSKKNMHFPLPMSKSAQALSLTGMMEKLCSGIASAISVVTGFASSQGPLKKSLDLFNASCAATRNLKEVIVNILSVIQFTINWIAVQTVGYPLINKRTYEIYKQIDDIRKEFPDHLAAMSDPMRTHAQCDSYLKFYARMKSVAVLVATLEHGETAVKDFNGLFSKASSLVGTATSGSSNAQNRVEPVALCMVGASGLGKTTFVKFATQYIAHRLKLDSHQLFQQNISTEYDDGYSDQPFTLVDELFCSNDSQTVKAQAEKVLAMVNVAARPMNMSKAEMKGCVYDATKFYFFTTNVPTSGWKEFLRHMEAIHRRLAFTRYLCPHPDFYQYPTAKLQIQGWKKDASGNDTRPLTKSGAIDWTKYQLNENFEWRENGLTAISVLDDMIFLYLARSRQTVANDIDFEAHMNELGIPMNSAQAYSCSSTESLACMAALTSHRIPVVVDGLPTVVPTNAEKFVHELLLAIQNKTETAFLSKNPLPIWNEKVSPRCARICAKQWYNLGLHSDHLKAMCDQVEEIPPPDEKPKWYVRAWESLRETAFSFARSSFVSYAKHYLIWCAKQLMISFFTVVCVVGTFISAMMLLEWFFQKPHVTRAQGVVSYDAGNINRQRLRKLEMSHNVFQVKHAQSFDTSVVDETLRLAKHCLILQDLHSVTYVKAFAVGDRDLLINAHNIGPFERFADFTVNHNKDTHGTFKQTEIDIFVCEQMDVAIIRLPARSRQYPELSEHFVKEDDLLSISGEYHKLSYSNVRTPVVVKTFVPVGVRRLMYIDDLTGTKYFTFGVTLPVKGSPGDCGEPTMCYNTSLNPRNIVGIHASGNETTSDITLVTQELLQALRSIVPLKRAQGLVDRFTSEEDLKPHKFELPKTAINVRKNKFPTTLARRTAFCKTPYSHCFPEPITAPAVLFSTDPLKSPLGNAYEAAITLGLKFDPVTNADLRSISHHSAQMLISQNKRCVLSVHEAINGGKNIAPMVLDSSPGYPFVRNGHSTKATLLEGELGNYKMKQELYDMYKELYDALAESTEHNVVFIDSLKDELRPLAKVEACMTRLYMAGPMHLTIIGRMLFGAWMHSLNYTRKMRPESATCAVGVDINGPELVSWSRFWKDVNYILLAVDLKKYDWSQDLQHALPTVEAINRWYNDGAKFATMRINFIKCLYNSTHSILDILYDVLHGNPSGNPLTAQINSVNLESNTALAIYRIASRNGISFKRPEEVLILWKAWFYGDDSLIAIPASWGVTYTLLCAELLKLGFTATPASKGEFNQEVDSLETATFLKREFVMLENRLVARLPLEQIYDIPHYIRRKNMCPENFLAQFQAMMVEAFWHGEAVYDEVLSRIRTAAAELNISLSVIPSYKDVLFDKNALRTGPAAAE